MSANTAILLFLAFRETEESHARSIDTVFLSSSLGWVDHHALVSCLARNADVVMESQDIDSETQRVWGVCIDQFLTLWVQSCLLHSHSRARKIMQKSHGFFLHIELSEVQV